MLKYFNGVDWIYVPTATSSEMKDVWKELGKKMDKTIIDAQTSDKYFLEVRNGIPFLVKEEKNGL